MTNANKQTSAPTSGRASPGRVSSSGNMQRITITNGSDKWEVGTDIAAVFIRSADSDASTSGAANLRRLVACWNAMQGVPTEVVEAIRFEQTETYKGSIAQTRNILANILATPSAMLQEKKP